MLIRKQTCPERRQTPILSPRSKNTPVRKRDFKRQVLMKEHFWTKPVGEKLGKERWDRKKMEMRNQQDKQD